MAMDHSADSIEWKAMSTEKAAQRHIWVITGPAGCGKTSVAEYLHSAFDFPYLEGDKVRFSLWPLGLLDLTLSSSTHQKTLRKWPKGFL